MRIIHTSDWHLGQYFYGKNRANEHQHFLNWLFEQIEQHNIDALIVAGDIFDTGTPPSYAREMYFDFIAKLAKNHCQLVLLAGNHDSVAMLSESKQLLASVNVDVIASVTEKVEQQIITIKNNHTAGKREVKNEVQGLICAIPFIRPRDVLKSQSGQTADEKKQDLQQAISKLYQATFIQAQKIRAGLDNKNIPIIATGHLTTVGATTTDSVRDIYIGTLEAFPVNAFPSADYIALGHIHKSQRVGKTENIRYCGSPIPLSFDEAKQPKKILMVDFKRGKFEKVTEIIVPRFQTIAMLKTSIASLLNDVEKLMEQHVMASNDEKLWLDVEIESGDYLQDLHEQIAALTQDFPLEILLIRRSKKSRKLMNSTSDKTTLNELNLNEVFNKRLALEPWQNDENKAQKARLIELFDNVTQNIFETRLPTNTLEKSALE